MQYEIKDLDVVRLKDGREGTVVYIGTHPLGYLIELVDKEGEIVEVSPEQIEKVVWKAEVN